MLTKNDMGYLFVVFVAIFSFGFVDAYLTAVASKDPLFYEINPISRAILESFGFAGLVVQKLFASALITAILYYIWRKNRKGYATFGLFLYIVIMMIIIINNISVLGMMVD